MRKKRGPGGCPICPANSKTIGCPHHKAGATKTLATPADTPAFIIKAETMPANTPALMARMFTPENTPALTYNTVNTPANIPAIRKK